MYKHELVPFPLHQIYKVSVRIKGTMEMLRNASAYHH